jgi:hypothetical protein
MEPSAFASARFGVQGRRGHRRGRALTPPGRLARTVLLGALLVGMTAQPPTAAASGPGTTPSAQPAPVTTGNSGPTPDPAGASTGTTNARSGSTSHSGAGASPPGSTSGAPHGPTVPATPAPPVTTVVPSGRTGAVGQSRSVPPAVGSTGSKAAGRTHHAVRARRRSHRLASPSLHVKSATPQVGRRGLVGVPAPAAIVPTARRDGVLLLFAALALIALVVASLALLRLLSRLHGEWDEGAAV